ncbi:DALR anticodon-binding domain-containing protein, partial [Vallitalea maricola]
NRFYHNCPIIVDDMELRNARLEIVSIVRDVIREALSLLSIKAPEQM